jgi:hypothetical protein
VILIQYIDDHPKLLIKKGDYRNVDDSIGIELIKKGIARKVTQSEIDEARIDAKLRDTPNDETR